MRSKSLLALLVFALAAVGCAGLMMNVTDLDAAHANVVLKRGDVVSFDRPALQASFAAAGDAAQAPELAATLESKVAAKLGAAGVGTDPSSPRHITISITKFDRGCSFCRGFFPVFGLGSTYLNGNVALEGPEGRRTLVVEKTGQTSGMAEMGDQTATNMDYFATVVAEHLAGAPAAK